MRKKKIYERGDYYLALDTNRYGTPRSKNLYIFYYDREARRGRSYSTGTSDIRIAKEELDRFYETREKSHKFCPTCGQPFSGELPPLVATAIAEYLEDSDYEAASARLGHVLAYLEAKGLEDARCDEIDDDWVKNFRKWAAEVDIVSPTGKKRKRSPTTIAASISMLRTAINKAFKSRKLLHRAAISVKKSEVEGATPWFRASEDQLIRMFRYALVLDFPENTSEKQIKKWERERRNLLQYLRLGVATWARPDAIMDFSTTEEAKQWNPENGYLNLNPHGRVQSDKYRPLVRAPRQLVPLLNSNEGKFVKAASIRTAFRQMVGTLELPGDGQSGEKLLRRSTVSLIRPQLERIGAWETQGRLMLGHIRPTVSDKYATPYHEEYLIDALRLIEELIDRIEAAAPGAFSLD